MNCPTCGRELYDNGEKRFRCPFCGAEVEGSGSAPGESREETLEIRCQSIVYCLDCRDNHCRGVREKMKIPKL